MAKDKMVSIVMVTYNQLEYTKLCVESIQINLKNIPYEIIIVDNLSTDGTREWLKQSSDVKYFLNDTNKGFGAACNQGAALAEKGNDILMLNNDTIVMENSIQNLQRALYEDSNIGACGAVSNNASGRQKISEKFESLDDYFEYGRRNNIYDKKRHKNCVRLIGFAIMLRYDVWQEIGGFSLEYGKGFFEDDDLCMQLLKKDYVLIRCEDSFIYHFGGVSFSQLGKGVEPIMADNLSYFEQKWKVSWKQFYEFDKNAFIDQIMEEPESEFRVLDLETISGATLLEIRNKFPNAKIFGMKENPKELNFKKGVFELRDGGKESWCVKEDELYDYVVAGNVLQHLYNPWDEIINVWKHMRIGGTLFLSIQNAMHISCVYSLLQGQFSYTENDCIHNKKNIRFFTLDDIRELLQKAGFSVQDEVGRKLRLSELQREYIDKLIEMDSSISRELLEIDNFVIKVIKC